MKRVEIVFQELGELGKKAGVALAVFTAFVGLGLIFLIILAVTVNFLLHGGWIALGLFFFTVVWPICWDTARKWVEKGKKSDPHRL